MSSAPGSSLTMFKGCGRPPHIPGWGDCQEHWRKSCVRAGRGLSKHKNASTVSGLQINVGKENFQNSLGSFRIFRVTYINNKMCFFRITGFLVLGILPTQICISYLSSIYIFSLKIPRRKDLLRRTLLGSSSSSFLGYK